MQSTWAITAFLVTAAAAGGGTEPAAAPHPFCFDDMFGMHRLSDPQPSPDGEWVAYASKVYSLETNRSSGDLWLVSLDGKTTLQLTTNEAQDYNPRWSPDGATIAFLSTRSGSAQIWTIDPRGGEAVQLSDFPVDVSNLSWSPDGERLAFSAEVYPDADMKETAARDKQKEEDPVKARIYTTLLFRHWDTWEDGKRSHVFVMPAKGGEAVDLMQGIDADCPTMPFGGGEEIAWAPDSQELCLTVKMVENAAWSTDVDLYVTPVTGGDFVCITEENEAWDSVPAYSPDGSRIAYLAMRRPGYEADRAGIVLFDRASGERRELAPDWDASVSEIAWTEDGGALIAAAEENALKPLFRVDATSGAVTKIVPSHYCAAAQVAAGGRLVFCQDSMCAPVEIFTCAADGKGLGQLTHVNDERLAQALRSDPENVWFEGAGGDRVHAWLLRPVGFEQGKKYPLALMVHGGPQGCWNDHFHYRWNPQIYAGAGYVVLGVNFHGSTSFGQEFCDSIRGDWGGKPFEDLMKGVDHALAAYDFIDPERMGALGASYGGYLITWVAGQTDRFKALICHDGNMDERAAYFMTEELWFPEWDHVGTPWDNPRSYEEQNPVNFVQNWKTPMLVIHGGHDFRVVESSGMSTFTALQRLGVPSRFLHFPDENHWVLKPKNSQLWHREVLAWLDQWVKGA
ncbi:MAG: S9 family peptidase [Planctomycetes bacterium]|nr:S9 family peptidase [Planctomycetota bacterium]